MYTQQCQICTTPEPSAFYSSIPRYSHVRTHALTLSMWRITAKIIAHVLATASFSLLCMCNRLFFKTFSILFPIRVLFCWPLKRMMLRHRSSRSAKCPAFKSLPETRYTDHFSNTERLFQTDIWINCSVVECRCCVLLLPTTDNSNRFCFSWQLPHSSGLQQQQQTLIDF